MTNDGIEVISWNIHGIKDREEGLKINIPAVSDQINKHHIFCLQETKEPIKMPNYKCFNSNREDSRSGGVCTGIIKSMSHGATLVPSNHPDIVIVKLRAVTYNLKENLNIINVYDSPSNSSYKKRKGIDETSTIEALQECLLKIPYNEFVSLNGDLNARSGTLDDTLPHELFKDSNSHMSSESYSNQCMDVPGQIKPRNNMDKTLNGRGKPFIEMIQAAELIILNGRTLGDIFGEPTCIQPNGVSTVDYCCVSRNFHKHVRSCRIGCICHYSDHRPVITKFSTVAGSIETVSTDQQ